MNNQKEPFFSQEFFKKLSEESNKKDSNPLIFFKIFAEEMFGDIEELKDERLFKAYDVLESKAGSLPIFRLADKLPENEKYIRYYYFFDDIKKSSFQLIGIAAQIKLKYNESILQSLKKKFFQFFFKGSHDDIISRYIIEWEVLYNTFVNPAYNQLYERKIIPTKQRGSGRQGEIDELINYFKTSDELKLFIPILECLETELRNSLVHLNYWIDAEKNLIYYYNLLQNDLEVKTYKFEDLCMKLILLSTLKFVYIIRIAISLT